MNENDYYQNEQDNNQHDTAELLNDLLGTDLTDKDISEYEGRA